MSYSNALPVCLGLELEELLNSVHNVLEVLKAGPSKDAGGEVLIVAVAAARVHEDDVVAPVSHELHLVAEAVAVHSLRAAVDEDDDRGLLALLELGPDVPAVYLEVLALEAEVPRLEGRISDRCSRLSVSARRRRGRARLASWLSL